MSECNPFVEYCCEPKENVCQDKTGKSQFTYWIPENGKLEYTYPNESKQTIHGSGLTYQFISEPSPFYGGQCTGVSYRPVIGTMGCGQFTWQQTTLSTNINGKIIRPIVTLLSQGLSCGGGDSRRRNNWRFQVEYITFAGVQTTTTIYANTSYVDFTCFGFVRSDGQPDCPNLPGQCTFKVFQGGNTIFSRTENVCPTINLLQECYFGEDPGKQGFFEISNLNLDKKIDVVQGISGNVRFTQANLRHEPTDQSVMIRKFESPAYCGLPPQICYFCSEKCPQGTCECTKGSTVCCYDPATGKVVKSFTRG